MSAADKTKLDGLGAAATISAMGLMSAQDKDWLQSRKNVVVLYQDDFGLNIANLWRAAVSGTGSSCALGTAGVEQYGGVRLGSGSTPTGTSELSSPINLMYTAGAWSEITTEVVAKLAAVSGGGENFKCVLAGTYLNLVGGGWGIYYDPAISANWLLTKFLGSIVTVDTGVPVDTVKRRFTTKWNATTIEAYIDGALVATTSSTSAGAHYSLVGRIEKTLGATPRNLDVDYALCYGIPVAPRP